jgi:hypothetical protein
MECILRDEDGADIAVMIAFRKQIAHKSTGIGVESMSSNMN